MAKIVTKFKYLKPNARQSVGGYAKYIATRPKVEKSAHTGYIFFCDEFGTLPKIESAEMMFSASRSRRLQIVPIIQSFSQLEKTTENICLYLP